MASPTKPLKDAIAEYQAAHPYSQQAFEGLFPYLQGQGYNVARTTHANNTLASNDALVDTGGNVYDLVFNSDNAPGAGAPSWTNNPNGTYDPNRSIVLSNGKFSPYSDWAKQYQTAGPTTGGTPTPGTTTGTSSGTTSTALGQGGYPAYRAGHAGITRLPPVKGSAAGSSGPPSPPTAGSSPYEAANQAAARARAMAQRGGRRGTILGGFGSGAPSTSKPTVLGY
jgi:hypothetical protein